MRHAVYMSNLSDTYILFICILIERENKKLRGHLCFIAFFEITKEKIIHVFPHIYQGIKKETACRR